MTYETELTFDRIHKENNTILVNENIFKSLKLKIDEKIKVQDQVFIVAGIVKTVPDVSGFVAFGDFALTGKQTLDLIKLNIGSFLNYEYKVRFNESDDTQKIKKQIQDIFRSEEHTSELQSQSTISYAVFCLKKKTKYRNNKQK